MGGEIVKKSTILFILSLVGGIIVLLVGADRLIDIALFGSYGGADTGLDAALDVGFGMTCGLLMIGGSIMLFRRPQHHRIWGALVLIFSLLSIVGTAGGVFIGLLFGLIGSIYAIVSKPAIPQS
jgi:hypothetical protein